MPGGEEIMEERGLGVGLGSLMIAVVIGLLAFPV